MSKQTAKFSKVSEWIAAGNMASGFYLMEGVERETEKAVGFKAQKFNAAAYLKPATCWIPKSQMQEVQNDFYTNGAARMFLLPAWLYSRKEVEGYVL